MRIIGHLVHSATRIPRHAATSQVDKNQGSQREAFGCCSRQKLETIMSGANEAYLIMVGGALAVFALVLAYASIRAG